MTARSRNSNAHLAGLKAQLDVRDERMRLADERREEVQKTAERLTGQVDVLTAQLQQHAAPAEIERTAGIIQSTTTATTRHFETKALGVKRVPQRQPGLSASRIAYSPQ